MEPWEFDWSTYGDSLAFRLVLLRNGLGLTQDDVAERAGISRNAVQLLEHNHGGRPDTIANPSLQRVYRIAAALGVRPADLLPDAQTVLAPRSPEQADPAAQSAVEAELTAVLRRRGIAGDIGGADR